jgi:hypothetical protein
MARVTQESFAGRAFKIDGDESLVLLFWGSVPYVTHPKLQHRATESLQFEIDASGMQQVAPEGPYTLIVVPQAGSEYESRQALDLSAGLVAAVLGRNIAYQLVFDNTVNLVQDNTTVFSPIARNPLADDPPDLTDVGIEELKLVLPSISGLPELVRNRVEFALHWHEEAARSPATDQFLKRWIALEALGMSERENIRPLNESLAISYGLSVQEAAARFSVGRIFGFRSRIVHRGERLPVHGVLEQYVEALFRDVLFQKIGLPPRGFAAAITSVPSFDLRAFLHEA